MKCLFLSLSRLIKSDNQPTLPGDVVTASQKHRENKSFFTKLIGWKMVSRAESVYSCHGDVNRSTHRSPSGRVQSASAYQNKRDGKSRCKAELCLKWNPIPYIVLYFWPGLTTLTRTHYFWPELTTFDQSPDYVGNRVPFGMHAGQQFSKHIPTGRTNKTIL